MHTPRRTQAPAERVLAGLAFLAAGALAVAVPLVWDSGALEMFRGPKSDLALAAWALLAAVFVVRNLGGGAWRDPWWFAWGGVLAGGVLSAVTCPSPARSLGSLLPLALAALGWGAVRQLNAERRRTLSALVVWAGLIEAALVLLFLRPAWQPESFALLAREGGRYEWIGTLGNPGDAAVFLVLPALLAADRAISTRRLRLPYAAAAVFMAGVILGTRTITAVLAAAVGALVLAWRRVPGPRRPLLAGAVLAVVVVAFAATPLAQRVRAAANEARGGGLLWLGSGRAAGYAAAAAMVTARPATGVGFGLFEANSFRFQSQDALAERGRVLGLVTGFGDAHNDLLQYAAETGAIGVLLAGASLVLAARRWSRGDGAVVAGWPLAAAALVLALTQFPLHLAAVASQWVLLAALALPPLPPAPEAEGWAARGRLLAAGVLAGAALTLTWQHYRATTLFQQGRLLSESLRSGQVRPETRAEAARAALTNLVPGARVLPYSWEAAVILGNVAMDAGDTRLAIASFGRALALAERPEVQFNVGIALIMAGDRANGIAHLVRAVQLNPAVFREVRDPELSRALRRNLDASGYGAKHPWMYQGTPAASP
jgi:tetratricopeptide (TPR) repeat protein